MTKNGMLDVKFNKNTWYITIIEYILLIFLFLSSNSVYWTATNALFKKLIMIAILGCSFMLSLIFMTKIKENISRLMILLFLYYFVMIPFSLYHYSMGGLGVGEILRTLVFPMTVSPFLLYDLTSRRKSTLSKKFVNIGVVMAFVSLLLWGISFLTNYYNTSIQILWGGVRNAQGLFYIQFFPQGIAQFFGIPILRNSGVFSEAPMYSFVLSVVLMVHLFLNKNSKLYDSKTLILVITMITTTSTTAILIVMVCFFFKYYLQTKRISKLLIVFLVPALYIAIQTVLTAKVSDMGGSVDVRLDDIKVGYQAWKLHPFLGNGLENRDVLIGYMDNSRQGLNGNTGFSSGVMSLLSRGGLVLFLSSCLIPLIMFAKNRLSNLFLSITFFVLALVSIVDGTYLYLFLIFYLYISSIYEYENR